MVRFLHTADWQIGKPFGRVRDEAKRFRIRQERLDVVARIGAAARAAAARFVLVAGDLFDSTTVPPPVVMETLEAIGRFGVPVVVIPGNHDHGAAGTLWHREDLRRGLERRAPNLLLLLERRPLVLDGAVLLPCPLLRQHDAVDPTAWIRGVDWTGLPADLPRIVLAHGAVQGFAGRDYELDGDRVGGLNRLDLGGLPAAEIDYVALGDWHALNQVGPATWYPGTPEPDRFPRSEDERRGQVLQVELRRGAPPQVEVIPTGRLGWHSLRLRIGDDDDLERLERRIREHIGDRVQQDLLRLEVRGGLSLAGHRRWHALLEELDHQLLHLRLKGDCERIPRAEELERLLADPGSPLIGRVAARLQERLARAEGAGDGADEAEGAERAAVLRLALSELHRLAAPS